MGLGWEMYGQQAGYSQKQWDALPQAKKDDIKAFIDGLGGPNTSMFGGTANVIRAGAEGGAGIYPQGAAPPQDSYGYDDGGGYGYGGGGGNLPPRQLASSPEWLAFLNALGLEEGQFRSDIDRQRAFASSAAQHQLGQLEPQYDLQRRSITGSQESRGMARSGEHLKRLADSRAAQGRDASNINMGLGQTLSSLESSLANKMMDLGARRAQQELSLRASGYV